MSGTESMKPVQKWESFGVASVSIEEEKRRLDGEVYKFFENSLAANTARAYQSDWKQFKQWCEQMELKWLPASAQTLARYLAHMADRRYAKSTVQRKLSSISQAHVAAHYASPMDTPEMRSAWKGAIRRQPNGDPPKIRTNIIGKDPLLTDDLKVMIQALMKKGLIGLRDRALLLLGFAGAFRRSEIVSLTYEDIQFVRDGLIVRLRWSKTDQEGEGYKKGIPYFSTLEMCPVRTVEEWLDRSQIQTGPLFRGFHNRELRDTELSTRSVARIVKQAAELAELDATKYSGHSLRSGFVTSATISGAGEREIMSMTGHKSLQTMRGYIRDGQLFRDNAASKLRL